MDKWLEDPVLAEISARSLPRPAGSPPHWLRCNFINQDGKRCRKGDGHSEDHEAVKEPSVLTP